MNYRIRVKMVIFESLIVSLIKKDNFDPKNGRFLFKIIKNSMKITIFGYKSAISATETLAGRAEDQTVPGSLILRIM